MRKYIQLAVVFLLVTGAFVPSSSGQFFFFLNPMVGQEAPDFTLNTISRNNVKFSEYRDGKKAIIFFWATWCPHCRVALAEMNKEKDKFIKQGIKLVMIDIGENKKTVENYVKKNKIDFDVFLDEDQSVAEQFGLMGVPTFVYVTPKGIVNEIQHQLLENYEEILEDES